MPYITERWLGGCLTNFNAIKKSIKKYNDLVERKKAGKLDKYTKKERLEFDREIAKLEMKVGGLAKLNKVPDIIFIWDIKKEKTAVAEAKKKKIPIIGICDTNVNPEGIDYVIPANDDATKTIKLILNLVKEVVEESKKENKK
jgi:small subunit ribosomal protein S2